MFDKLAKEGASLLVRTLKMLEDGTATRTKQDDSHSSYAKMLSKDMGCLDFSKDAVILERLIRGLNPWPSAYTAIQGKTLKIYAAEVVAEEECTIAVDKKSFTVRCGNGALRIYNLQLEGKKRMDTSAFLLGYKVENGMQLGGR